MAWNLITSGSGHGHTGGTLVRDTRGADFIVIGGLLSSAGGLPFVDDLGNTWLTAGQGGAGDPALYSLGIYYCRNPITSETHTFTTSVAFGHILMAAYSGSNVSPLDGAVVFDRRFLDGISGVAGPVTPTADDALVLVFTSHGGGAGSAAGFTTVTSIAGVSGQHYGGLLAAQVQTTAAPISATASWPTSERPMLSMVAFKGTGPLPVAPTITDEPDPIAVVVGQTATFTAVATGTAPLSYQWRKNGSNISGATAASYTTPATISGDNGAIFSVVVTNAQGSDTSGDVTLIVNAAPPAPTGVVVANAVSGQSVTISGTCTNSASATASLAVGSPANGAVAQGPVALTVTGDTFSGVLTGVPPGSYLAPLVTLLGLGGSTGITGTTIEIIGIDGEAVASAAAIAPAVTTQPAPQSATAGASVTFTSAASGVPSPTPQWQSSEDAGVTWTNTAGATSASYSLTALLGETGRRFRCVWTNASGTATSNTATLTVSAATVAPVIALQPVSQSALQGAAVSFTITATGTGPLTYQWRRNSVAISGATSSTLTITTTLADNGALYTCAVSNVAGSATSAPATLTVAALAVAPSFVAQPQAITVVEGNSATFSALAAGTAPLAYQWLRDGVPIPGATAVSYTLDAATVYDSDSSFVLRVSNSAQTVFSASAILTVMAAEIESRNDDIELVQGASPVLASRSYVGDVGTSIELDAEIPLAGAVVSILALKPNGATVTWPATGSRTIARFVTRPGDLDIPGRWKLQLLMQTPEGRWLGKTFRLRVYAAFA